MTPARRLESQTICLSLGSPIAASFVSDSRSLTCFLSRSFTEKLLQRLPVGYVSNSPDSLEFSLHNFLPLAGSLDPTSVGSDGNLLQQLLVSRSLLLLPVGSYLSRSLSVTTQASRICQLEYKYLGM
jgi:hypothetical protein